MVSSINTNTNNTNKKKKVRKQFGICTRDRLQDCTTQAAQGGCAGSIHAGFQDQLKRDLNSVV